VIKDLIVVGILTTTWGATTANAQLPQSRPAAVQSSAQQPEAAARQIEDRARRFGVGVQGGVGIDPELIDLGAHATFGGIFRPNLAFRPGLELGAGEVTTFFGINLDFVYALPANRGEEGWVPYLGVGPTFGLSHQNFDVDDDDIDDDDVDEPGRFDFSDTDFNGGMNFIVGMRRDRLFFEMKATAWGVSNIRLVAGYNF
jgi:hypothetical protein